MRMDTSAGIGLLRFMSTDAESTHYLDPSKKVVEVRSFGDVCFSFRICYWISNVDCFNYIEIYQFINHLIWRVGLVDLRTCTLYKVLHLLRIHGSMILVLTWYTSRAFGNAPVIRRFRISGHASETGSDIHLHDRE